LFVFKHLIEDKTEIYDLPESASYISKEKAMEIARKILVFNNEVGIRKFISKIRRSKIRSTEKILEDKIDIDKLINMFVQEFYDKRLIL